MKNYLTFGNIQSSLYGVFISGSGRSNYPARRYEAVQIPGRNGDLLLPEKRYENITVTYPAFFMPGTGFGDNPHAQFQSFMQQILAEKRIGYKKLTDTYDADTYRMAYFSGGTKLNMSRDLRSASFNLEFSCKPQRFLVSGDTAITYTSSSQSLSNQTYNPSKPLICVSGNGTLTISNSLFSYTVTLTITNNANSQIYIDCETCDCYRQSLNLNGNVSCSNADFPMLYPSNNTIVFEGLTEVQITPRWFTV